ncbi:hypothetical protein NMY22_g1862 [Coprinellus aureogranulatus]|nr:hypothetical protein NMY22_g1862 [Coprinellus aureogranulatus]
MEHIVSVTIIGAGYAGIDAAITLKKELEGRVDLVVYEKADRIGGTWRVGTLGLLYSRDAYMPYQDSIYPGAAADSAVHIYSLSSHPNPNWSSTNPPQPEILAYMNSVVDQAGLAPHIQFNRKLISAKWDPSTFKYSLEVEDTTTGSKFISACHVLIAATGILHIPDLSGIPGVERFEGKLLHTSSWDPNIDLRNKKVAVIGNGPSGCQILPAIADSEGVEVTQFFRKANWFIPAVSTSISSKMQQRFRRFPSLLPAFRFLLFWVHELLYLFIFGSTFLRSTLTEKLCRRYVKRNAPLKYHSMLLPDYPLGCQRIVFNVSYLQTLHKPNVKLVKQPVKRFTDSGLLTVDGQLHRFDVIIAATGYMTHLAPFEIHGKRGSTLQAYYDRHGGPEAYKGAMVPGFPNFFMLGGPNIATGYMSYILSIDCQLQLIIPLVKRLTSTEFVSYEVTQRASYSYNRKLRKMFRNTVWNTMAGTHFKDPGSGKIILVFPGRIHIASLVVDALAKVGRLPHKWKGGEASANVVLDVGALRCVVSRNESGPCTGVDGQESGYQTCLCRYLEILDLAVSLESTTYSPTSDGISRALR